MRNYGKVRKKLEKKYSAKGSREKDMCFSHRHLDFKVQFHGRRTGG